MFGPKNPIDTKSAMVQLKKKGCQGIIWTYVTQSTGKYVPTWAVME